MKALLLLPGCLLLAGCLSTAPAANPIPEGYSDPTPSDPYDQTDEAIVRMQMAVDAVEPVAPPGSVPIAEYALGLAALLWGSKKGADKLREKAKSELKTSGVVVTPGGETTSN